MRTIRDIDSDHNGYITNQELDDIIKLHYAELKPYYLMKLFDRFTDPIQVVLVDYKKFRDAI